MIAKVRRIYARQPFESGWHHRAAVVAMLLVMTLLSVALPAAEEGPAADGASVPAMPPAEDAQGANGLAPLSPGDAVSIQVYGQPDLNTTAYVGNDGTIHVPLAGPVPVSGITAVAAAARVEQALKDGQYLREPHVTLMVVHSTSQQVSVFGEVHQPGQFQIAPNTTVLDLLARAGGLTQESAETIYVLRPDGHGKVTRIAIGITPQGNRADDAPTESLRGGDSILVPRAAQFYIYGEINKPDKYRVHDGITVIQAITLAGGLTPRGSDRRVDIKRMDKDGHYVTSHARASDPIQPDDIIHVKESLF